MHIMSDKTLGIILDSLFRPNKCHKLLSKCLIGCLNNHSLLTLSLFQRTNSTVHSTFKYYTLQRKKKNNQKNYNCLFWKGKKKCVEISFFLLLPVDSKLRSQIPSILPYIWNIIYRMTTLIYDSRLWWWSLPFWNAKI